MKSTTRTKTESNLFLKNLPAAMQFTGGDAEALLLREYGSVFVARGGVVPPDRVIFRSGIEVEAFQDKVEVATEMIGGFEMTLQMHAMYSLEASIEDALAEGLSITPRAADSGKRSYESTIDLWASRVEPALDHWTALGRLAHETAAAIRSLPPFEQVPEILKLESEGMWFAKDLSKSIIYSVAPPGTSQHLSMLAFDVREHADARVREILSSHCWHRTVVSDLPHFTFLGMREWGLPSLGLKKTSTPDGEFWIPEI